MAAERDVFVRARGRTFTAFRQGTRLGARASVPAPRGESRAERQHRAAVPAGSVPRRAAERDGRAEGRPAAFAGGSRGRVTAEEQEVWDSLHLPAPGGTGTGP